MAREHQDLAARVVEMALGVRFERPRKLGGWGQADGCGVLADGRLVVLEIECAQKHPDTNILKLWPYLEDDSACSVLLVQVFFEASLGRGSSRDRLGAWLAERMQRELAGRFRYCRLVLGQDGSFLEGLAALKDAVAHVDASRMGT